MQYQDYYKTLGVSKNATDREIKRAYRKLARKFHPDVSKAKDAESRFKELGEAYEVLKDPEKRAAYDQLGKDYRDGQNFRPPPNWDAGFEFEGGGFTDADQAGFSDFFETLFGRRGGFSTGPRQSHRAQGRGEDHHARIAIGLEEAFKGATIGVELALPEYDRNGYLQNRTRSIQVKVPKGVSAGKRIRLAGQGGAGYNGGTAGDLYLEIELKPHRLFQVDGKDVLLTLPVSPWEAALGGKVKVPTLAGQVELTVPPGARTGQKLRLKGRGLGPAGKPAGDQIVVLKIVLPAADTDEKKAFYRNMAEKMPFDPRAELGG